MASAGTSAVSTDGYDLHCDLQVQTGVYMLGISKIFLYSMHDHYS